jgi:hypothetical protein
MSTPIQESERAKIYYFARRWWFQAKILDSHEVVHFYTSKDISKLIRAEYHEAISDSSIRRWSALPDKDFEGRTWAEEWNRLLTVGMLKAAEQTPTPEQSLFDDKPSEDSNNPSPIKSPAEQLVEMKAKSSSMITRIVTMSESIVFLMLQQIVESYKDALKEKKVWTPPLELLRALHPYYSDAKRIFQADMPNTIADVNKDGVDREAMFGNLVPLKDPAARERVRSVFENVLKELEKYGAELQKEKELQTLAKVSSG